MERNLMLGIMALQHAIIDVKTYRLAYTKWMADKQVRFDQVLLTEQWITPDAAIALSELVEDHVLEHHGDERAALEKLFETQAWKEISETDSATDIRINAETQGHFSPSDGGEEEQQIDFGDDETSLHVSQQRLHYKLTHVHGSGGLGRVWAAYDSRLNRQVALKEIRPDREVSDEVVDRFLQEAQITSQLEHPNIVPVYDLVDAEQGRQPFYTMRFLRGQTLRSAIQKFHHSLNGGSFQRGSEASRILNDFIAVCNAIAFAHSREVVHRDLKPNNIVLGEFGEVNVLDWGLAKSLAEPNEESVSIGESRQPRIRLSDSRSGSKTQDGVVVGTLRHLAPEQAQGNHQLTDQKTDIYGLGTILFEILTGKPPHEGKETNDILHDIVFEPAPRAAEAVPGTPAALDAICSRAMANERHDRYASAGDLANDVRCWLGDEPVTAYRGSWGERLARLMRRHRTWTQSIAAALLAVTVVSGVAAILLDSARRSERSANAKLEVALREENAAKDLAITARREEYVAKTQAVARLQDARKVVQLSLEEVSDELLNHPGLTALRERLLDQAVVHYERFAESVDSDPSLQLETALAYRELGDIHRLRADFPAARESYMAATKILTPLNNDKQLSGSAPLVLAGTQARIGEVLRIEGSVSEAQKAFQEALENYDAVIASEYAPEKADFEKAVALVSWGRLLQREHQFDQAIANLRMAIQQLEESNGGQQRRVYQFKQAEIKGLLGNILAADGQSHEGIDAIRGALNALDRLLDLEPDNSDYLEMRAVNWIYLGNACHPLGLVRQEEQAYRHAIEDYAGLVEKHDDIPHYRQNLAITQTSLAAVLQELGRNNAARDTSNSAVETFGYLINNYTNVPQYLEGAAAAATVLGRALMELEDNEKAQQQLIGARQIYSSLLTDFRDDPRYYRGLGTAQIDLGRFFMKQKQAEPAIELFRGAIEAFRELPVDDVLARDGLGWAHQYMSAALLASNDVEEARREMEVARETFASLPEQPRYMHNQVRLYTDFGLDDEIPTATVSLAKQTATTALENPIYWQTLAYAELLSGDLKQSKISAEKAIARQPDDACNQYLLAAICFRLQETSEGQLAFDKAEASDWKKQNAANRRLNRLRDVAIRYAPASDEGN